MFTRYLQFHDKPELMIYRTAEIKIKIELECDTWHHHLWCREFDWDTIWEFLKLSSQKQNISILIRILESNLNFLSILQPSNRAIKCGLSWSWNPKLKLNLGCHRNIVICMPYIHFLFHLHNPKMMELHLFKCKGNLVTRDHDYWPTISKILFLEIFFSYRWLTNMITIFTLIPEMSASELALKATLPKYEYRGRYSKLHYDVNNEVILIKRISFSIICHLISYLKSSLNYHVHNIDFENSWNFDNSLKFQPVMILQTKTETETYGCHKDILPQVKTYLFPHSTINNWVIAIS